MKWGLCVRGWVVMAWPVVVKWAWPVGVVGR